MHGSLYKVERKLYLDSQAVANIATVHVVVAVVGGWRVLSSQGSIFLSSEVHPALPGQRGLLYRVHGTDVKQACREWAERDLLRAGGRFDAWPGCKHTCACTPCRQRRAPEGA